MVGISFTRPIIDRPRGDLRTAGNVPTPLGLFVLGRSAFNESERIFDCANTSIYDAFRHN